MIALTFGQAKLVALAIVLVLIGLAIASALVMKAVAGKLAVAAVFCVLAVVVWTQRSSMQDCADRVRDQARTGQVSASCTFLGQDVTISTPQVR